MLGWILIGVGTLFVVFSGSLPGITPSGGMFNLLRLRKPTRGGVLSNVLFGLMLIGFGLYELLVP